MFRLYDQDWPLLVGGPGRVEAWAKSHSTHLRPGAGVPLEAGPLEASALLGGLLGQATLGAAACLRLPVGQLHAQDQPLLHASATGGIALGWKGGQVRGQGPEVRKTRTRGPQPCP